MAIDATQRKVMAAGRTLTAKYKGEQHTVAVVAGAGGQAALPAPRRPGIQQPVLGRQRGDGRDGLQRLALLERRRWLVAGRAEGQREVGQAGRATARCEEACHQGQASAEARGGEGDPDVGTAREARPGCRPSAGRCREGQRLATLRAHVADSGPFAGAAAVVSASRAQPPHVAPRGKIAGHRDG